MKQLPDILTSVTFWASVGTLWSAAGAWFTYVAAAVSSRQQTYEGVLNLIAGLEAELELVSEWASGGDQDQGYLQSKSQQQLIDEHDDWFNPTRLIFTFETPTLSSLTSSPQARSVNSLVRPFVLLNYSIRRLLDFLSHYQTFVASAPALYQSVAKKMSTAPRNAYSPEEQVYMNFVFGMNLKIHQLLIGGADSTDELCLYKAFRNARTALEEFTLALRREKLPRAYWILHIVAAGLALDGIWQVLRRFALWPTLPGVS
jgi:hypothetical protein